MSLRGTLADLGIVDLIQFPHSGKRTGELVVTSNEQQAKLYYDKGSLVHASLDDSAGLHALSHLVSWHEGSFEFVIDVETEIKSIDMDLHRVVMQALKLHDEMIRDAERREAEGKAGKEGDEALNSILKDFVAANDFVLHACVVSEDGAILAAANGQEGAPEEIEQIRSALQELLWSYPRRKVNRAILEDDLGTVVLARLAEDGALIVATSKEASLRGRQDTVETLLAHNSNVNARGERGCTALMEAAFRGHFDIVKRLLKAGAAINIRDKDGLTALTLAIRKRHFETAKFLVSESAEVISGDAGGRNPLMWAASAGCVRLAERLLDRGAAVNATSAKDGRTALMEAYRKGHKDMARMLVRRGAVFNRVRNSRRISVP